MFLTSNIANAYLVHILGHETYGDYSITIALIFSLTPLMSIGTLKSITKFIPILLKKDPNQANVFLKWNIGVLIKSCVIVIFLLTLLYLISKTGDTPQCTIENCKKYYHLFYDVFYIIPVSVVAIWLNRLLNATNHPALARVFNTPSLVYLTALITFIFTLINNSLHHTDLILIIFIAFFILTLIQSLIVFITLSDSPISYRKILKSKVQKKQKTEFFNSSVGMMINSIGYIALNLECLLLLEWLGPNESSLGYYVVVTKIGAASGLVGLSIAYLLNPAYSNIKDSKRLSQLQTLLKYNALIGLLWLIITFIIFLICKSFIFKYYSIDFPKAEISIILLFVFNYLASALRKYETICFYNNLNKSLIFITITQFVISAICCLILIPKISYFGTIISLIISESISFALAHNLLRKNNIYLKVFGLI